MLYWPSQAMKGPKLNITGTTSCVKFASEPSKAQRLRCEEQFEDLLTVKCGHNNAGTPNTPKAVKPLPGISKLRWPCRAVRDASLGTASNLLCDSPRTVEHMLVFPCGCVEPDRPVSLSDSVFVVTHCSL